MTTFRYHPLQDDRPPAGATAGWQYWHTKPARPGPALGRPVVALNDDDGVITIVPTGEWREVTITALKGDQAR